MGMVQEFKAFVMRGNVVDLAVGVIIGAAFGAIVTSLTENVLMPPIGWAAGGVNLSEYAVELPGTMPNPAHKDKSPEELAKVPAGERTVPVRIGYGRFLQKVLDFLIIAACLFFVVKGMNRLQRREAEKPPEPPATSTEKLLAEIRDLLRDRRGPVL